MAQGDELTPDQKPAAEAPPPGKPAAPTWWTLFAGFSFIATIGVLAGILLLRFLHERPINIEEHSAKVPPQIARALVDTMIPSGAVSRSREEMRTPRGDRWIFTHIEVAVPHGLDVAGVASLLEKRLEAEGLKLTREHREGAGRVLKVWLGNFEVARVTLYPAPPPQVQKEDWRPQTKPLARKAGQALESLGVPHQGVFMGAVETREDREAKWSRTRIEARAAKLPSPGELVSALEAALRMPDLRVYEGGLSTGGRGVTVTYRNRTTLEVALIPSRGMPPGPVAHGPMNAQPGLEEMLDEAMDPRPPLKDKPKVEVRELEWDSWEAPRSVLPAPAEPSTPAEPAAMPAPPGPREKPAARGKTSAGAKLSIILDDGGFGGEVTERVLSLDPRLTLAILPNTPEGIRTAERAREKGFEVMLHMPMENSNPAVADYPGEVTVGMAPEEVARLTRDAMAQTPGAVGVNNHTGSTFTKDAGAMAGFLEVVKQQNWYFIDSRTTPDSAAYDVARRMDVPAARRDVFLDNVDEPGAIRKEWERALRLAKQRGQAIVIGHFRPLTVSLLEEELPRLAGQGITLVHASELVQ